MKHWMIRAVTIGILSLTLNGFVPATARAYTSEWFTITRISTGGSCEDLVVIEGTFAGTECTQQTQMVLTNTTSCGTYDEPNQKNFDFNKKLLMSAFLAGKEVLVAYNGCQNNYASILAVYVCADGTSCGQ